MKLYPFFTIVTMLAFYSCSPEFSLNTFKYSAALPSRTLIVLLPKNDSTLIKGERIGDLKYNKTINSLPLDAFEIEENFKQGALNSGANLIKVDEQLWYKDHLGQVTATMYKVDDVKKYEREIEWTKERKLTWDDFKAPVKKISLQQPLFQTSCNLYLTPRYAYFKDVTYQINNIFNCALSYADSSERNNPMLLKHAQGLFDLCEVYKKILQKKVESGELNKQGQNRLSTKDITKLYKTIYYSYLLRKTQYEKETNYGYDNEKQAIWTKQIETELLNFDNNESDILIFNEEIIAPKDSIVLPKLKSDLLN